MGDRACISLWATTANGSLDPTGLSQASNLADRTGAGKGPTGPTNSVTFGQNVDQKGNQQSYKTSLSINYGNSTTGPSASGSAATQTNSTSTSTVLSISGTMPLSQNGTVSGSTFSLNSSYTNLDERCKAEFGIYGRYKDSDSMETECKISIQGNYGDSTAGPQYGGNFTLGNYGTGGPLGYKVVIGDMFTVNSFYQQTLNLFHGHIQWIARDFCPVG